MKRNTRIFFILSLITLVGLLFRTWNLTNLPAGFFCDEAATGYNAYSLATKGIDEYGKRFPLFFESFGNWRPALPFYITIPFVWLFGLTEFSTRLPSAVIGTFTIIVIFFLTKELTKNSQTGLLASGLLAVSPWHIHFSRVGQENIYLPFFITFSLCLLMYANRKQSVALWILTGLSFGLSLYSYFPAYYLSPLIFGTTIIAMGIKQITHDKKIWISIAMSIVMFGIMFFPLVTTMIQGKILNRLTQISKSVEDKTQKEIIAGMARTYTAHFSSAFLFSKGDIGYDRHFITRYSVRGMGQLYWFQLPLIAIGVFLLWKHKRKAFGILITLVLLYPIGSTLAPFADGGGPFATRSIIGIIPFTILSAVGLSALVSLWNHGWVQKSIIFLCSILMEVSISWYAYEYIHRYNGYASDFWGWQYGARTLMQYALDHKNLYDEIIIPDSAFNTPEIFLKFYDPLNTCRGICVVGDTKRKYNKNLKQLFMIPNTDKATPDVMRHLSVQQTVLFPNGNPAFFIGTFPPTYQPAL